MGKFDLSKMICIVSMFCIATAIASQAQTFTTLVNFDFTDGSGPNSDLVQGTDGNFYGTTLLGGAHNNCTDGCGTVFEVTPSGTLTTLHSFDGMDGYMTTGLVQGTDGNFYGTTANGGANNNCANGCGTVFKLTAKGALTTLHSFDGTHGSGPYSGLVQGTDGNFYGTTSYGGANTSCTNGCGTVFKITPNGALTTLHSFDGTDGSNPNAALVQGTDGNFYGTTSGGGAIGDGTVFRVTAKGVLTTLHSFDGTDGSNPTARLVQGADGEFYGTTETGGAGFDGTVFKITAKGALITLHGFDGTDGYFPYAGLVQATDGNFYGTTQGATYGTVFKITAKGVLTTLHSFDGNDGSDPQSAPVQATNGMFYGTTYNGGSSSYGTVFSLSLGLGPFVETNPASGKVGTKVIILGTNLNGATSVSFYGTAATFTVVSGSEITTTVPAGALTGKVSVKTPSATLKSNLIFRVTPQFTDFTPTSGAVGTLVKITGVSLKQTTAVTFGGVKATAFTVNSNTQVTATVPMGAKTGKIAVTTPGGSASSAATFTVTP
jgi:uncharacterized repeat protein (TIGR03803 family)